MMIEPLGRESETLFFRPIVEGYVNNPRFLRRDWLAAEVNERLQEPDCRFVLLTAEPGAGKSTFLAQLAYDHPQRPVYFIRRDQRTPLTDGGSQSFLLRLGYQLAAAHPELFTPEQVQISVQQRVGQLDESGEVVGAEVDRIVASPFYQQIVQIKQQVRRSRGNVAGLRVGEWVVDPRLLPANDLQNMALIDPAWALLKEQPDEQIIVLVDALDELRSQAIDHSLLNWLTHCPELPANIRFVLTSRPPDEALAAFCDKQRDYLQTLSIETTDDRVLTELQVYARRLTASVTVSSVLGDAEQDADDFVDQIVQKADGNIGYLDAVARGLDQASKSEDKDTIQNLVSLQELPSDVEGLYAFFLRQIKTAVRRHGVEMEDPSSGEFYVIPVWAAVYKRVLGTLAVAFEPLSILEIKELGRISADSVYVTDAVDHLSQFLDQIAGRYRFYHATLPEFLTSRETLVNQDTSDFHIDAVSWHQRIAKYFWQNYGDDWLQCNLYGLNHLARHMQLSEERHRLPLLISKSWMDARYRGSQFTYGGFLQDVDIAWKTTTSQSEYQPLNLIHLRTARQIVAQQLGHFSNVDLKTLVWLGRLEEALSHARMRPKPGEKFDGLWSVYEAARESDATSLEQLLDEVAAAAPAVRSGKDWAAGLLKIAKARAELSEKKEAAFGEAAFEEAIEGARGVNNEYQHALAMLLVTEALIEYDSSHIKDMLSECDAVVRALGGRNQVWGIANLALLYSEAGNAGRADLLFKEANDSAESLEDASDRQNAFFSLVEALIEARRYDDALHAVHKLDDYSHGFIFQDKDAEQSGGGSAVSQMAIGSYNHAFMLGEIAATLSADGDKRAETIFDEAEEATNALEDDHEQAQALTHLAINYLSVGDGRADKTFAVVRQAAQTATSAGESMLDYYMQDWAKALAEAGRHDEALEACNEIDDAEKRAYARRDIAIIMAQAGAYDGAKDVSDLVDIERSRLWVLGEVALSAAKAGNKSASAIFQELQSARRSRIDKGLLVKALSRLGASLASIDRHDLALKLFNEAWSLAQEIDDRFEHKSAVETLAIALSRAHYFDDAFNLVATIPELEDRALALREIAVALAEVGDDRSSETFSQAWDAAEATSGENSQFWILLELQVAAVGSLAQAGLVDEAMNMANSISHAMGYAKATCAMASAMAKNGDRNTGEMFGQSWKNAQSMNEGFRKSEVLCEIAASMAEAGDGRAKPVFKEARKAVFSLPKDDKWLEPSAVSNLFDAYVRARRIDQATALLDVAASTSSDRAVRLRKLATFNAKRGRFEKALSMLEPENLDDYFETLAEWGLAFEQSQSGLALAAWQKVAQVAGWVRPDWEKIHNLLSSGNS